MFKHHSMRYQRSKGFKLKHALQICVLVAVCIWLLYQVKHSQNKKREVEDLNSRSAVNVDSNLQIPRLGRKDIPELENASVKWSRDDESEETEEGEHEVKKEEGQEEENLGAKDELDENDQDKGEEGKEGEDESGEIEEEKGENAQHDEKFGDGEENEAKSDVLSFSFSEKDNDEEEETISREAREEQYKGDDASSTVRDVETLQSEDEHHSGINQNGENIEKKQDDSDKSSGKEDDLQREDTGDGAKKEDDSAAVNEEIDANLSNSTLLIMEGDANLSNNTSLDVTDLVDEADRMEQLDNSTIAELTTKIEQLNNLTSDVSNNTTDADGQTVAENSTALEKPTEDLPSGNETVSMALDDGQDLTTSLETVSESKADPTEMDGNTNTGNATIELSEKTDMPSMEGGSEESSKDSSSSNDGGEAVTNESGELPKTSDDEKNARTDLSTLPEMQMDTRTVEDIAAE